jgi:glycosyltransferase involved in cell wall biosynthesis
MSTNIPKRKILIFSTAYHPFVGGAEVAVKEITDRLGSEFDFDLITARMDKTLPTRSRIGKVTVYRVGGGHTVLDKVLLPFRGALLASKLNKKHNYFCMWGIMVTFGTGAGFILNIINKLTFQKRVPIVLTLQEGDSENHLKYRWGGLIALSWRLSLWQTDMVTGISTFLLHRAQKNGFTGKSVLVPNGVDLELFSGEISEQTKEKFKKLLNKKEGDIFLVTSGRLTHKNATDDVISALPFIPSNIQFIIIGKGDEGKKLQKQANDLGVASRVKFVGFVPYADIPKYLSVCDIFIRPSRSEGFGNSFIEAMAAGIPVIATPVGGIPDFIDDGGTGVFCSSDNPQSIVRSVSKLLNDSELRERIIKNAQNRARERYGWETVALQMKDVFDLFNKKTI